MDEQQEPGGLGSPVLLCARYESARKSHEGVTGRCSNPALRPDCRSRSRDRIAADANRWRAIPARGIHHVDLAVSDVERSLSFYLNLLGPLGWFASDQYPTYRGTEEVVYLGDPSTGSMLGIRPADGGTHRYYEVGIEHLAFEVDEREEVDEAHTRCLSAGANIHFPPEEDRDVEGYYAFFVFDPDGMRVEVFCWPRSRPLTQVAPPTSGAS